VLGYYRGHAAWQCRNIGSRWVGEREELNMYRVIIWTEDGQRYTVDGWYPEDAASAFMPIHGVPVVAYRLVPMV